MVRRLARQAPLLLVALLSCSTGSVRVTGGVAGGTIDVDGRLVPAAGVTTVADALHRARVSVPAGRLLSAVTHRPLAQDHQPGQVLVDGMPATPGTPVRAGAVLTVVPGRDVVEPLDVARVPVAPAPQASLFVGETAGSARVVRGAVSGETLSRQVVAKPRAGHLVAPRAMALTFDDGPDPTWTPVVLRLLAAAHVHATFCVIGRQAAEHPELVRAIVAGGHQLCNHTWSHDEHLASDSPETVQAQLARTQRVLQAITGQAPRLFRAPGGAWTPAVVQEAQRQGMSPLKWSVDPRDWTRPGTARILADVLRQVRPGSIVLLHDGGGDRSQSAAALQLLLPRLAAGRWTLALPQP